MRIESIVRASCLGLLLAILVSAVVGGKLIRSIDRANEQLHQAVILSNAVSELTYQSNEYLLYQTDRAQRQWKQSHDRLTTLLAPAAWDDPQSMLRTRAIRQDLERSASVFNGLDDREDTRALTDRVRVLAGNMRNAVQELGRYHRRKVETTVNNLIWVGAGIDIVLLGFVAAVWTIFTRRVSSPLARLKGGLAAVGGGDLNRTLPVEAQDEFGEIAVKFNEMTTVLKRTTVSRDRLDAEVQRQTQDLQNMVREMEAFTYSVSHDLRGPLRIINGYIQALVEDYGDSVPDEGRHFLERITHASGKMSQIIDDLLSLSRTSRAEMKRQPVDISAAAASIAADLEPDASVRDRIFTIEPDLEAEADPNLLDSLLRNLMGNAFKFSSKVDAPHIHIGATPGDDGRPVFCIRDNGAGFDPKYMDKLFSPFQRLHRDEEFEGTGIGLATVYRIVEKHGGYVRADSSPGQGAAFHFTLQPEKETP